MATPKRPRLGAPWKGMDLRDTEATSGSATLALNMETRSGVLRPRRPLSRVATSALTNAKCHLVERPGMPRYLLAVGQGGADGLESGTRPVQCRILDPLTGGTLGTTTLTTERRRLPGGEIARCSFVDTFLRSTDGNPRPATLIVGEFGTWVFEPGRSVTSVSLADVEADASRIASSNMAYWKSVPRGPIAVMHGDQVAYAGFKDGTSATFTNPVETDATDIPRQFLEQGRASITLSPGMLYLSDEFDPLGIQGASFFFIANEEIRGIASAGEALLILTNKSIWALSGYDPATYTLQRVASGVSCASFDSVVAVGGVTYFAGDDGIYAFGGLGAPEVVRVSDGLGPLWDGWAAASPFLPDAMQPRLGGLGWPFILSQSAMSECYGAHVLGLDCIGWSVSTDRMPIMLVLDLAAKGWFLWFTDPDGVVDVMHRGAYEIAGKVYFVDESGGICVYDGPTNYDGAVSTATGGKGVPAFWLSQRFFPGEIDWSQVQGAWAKVLIQGSFPSNDGSSDTMGSATVPVDVPAFLFSGEFEAFDFVDDFGAASDYEKRGSSVTQVIPLVPHAGLPLLGTSHSNTQFLLGTHKLGGVDWYTARLEGNIRHKSFRFGLIDDARGNTGRGPRIALSAVEFNVVSEGTPRR